VTYQTDKTEFKMKTLNWKRTDWNARNFILLVGQEIIGHLTFNNFWDFNAEYIEKETKLKFLKKSFWDRDVLITKDGKVVGEIDFGLFRPTSLKLTTGERFTLSSDFWEQEVYWKNEQGETIIKYQQATMSSMGKGTISLNDSLIVEIEKLLICSGIFARQIRRKRAAFIVIIIPILAASSH
jgi:hypothetical protein